MLSKLPRICYTYAEDLGKIVALKKGADGYFEVGIPVGTDNPRERVEILNKQLGVSKAQERAMLCGSMFGWDTPAADPDNPINLRD